MNVMEVRTFNLLMYYASDKSEIAFLSALMHKTDALFVRIY